VLNALRHQRFGHETPSDKARLLRACSTPYGIRGLGTGPLLLLYLAAQSAQRLTASEVWAPAAVSNSAFFSSSAQRLTASEVWARLVSRNSFSNSSCSTPYGIRGLGTQHRQCVHRQCVVLNALRHQRFGHCEKIQKDITGYMCSTPYGIRGLGT